MAASDTFAIFGLFLLLAFIVPGSVYTFFSYIYFPEFVNLFLKIDATAAVGVVIVLGLLLSSICFAIELIIVHPMYRACELKIPNITILAKIEAAGKTNFYINQVFGQYIMHFNIGMGILILWALFFTINRFEIIQFFNGSSDWSVFYKLFSGIILGIVNIYLSVDPFRKYAVQAQKEYERKK